MKKNFEGRNKFEQNKNILNSDGKNLQKQMFQKVLEEMVNFKQQVMLDGNLSLSLRSMDLLAKHLHQYCKLQLLEEKHFFKSNGTHNKNSFSIPPKEN